MIQQFVKISLRKHQTLLQEFSQRFYLQRSKFELDRYTMKIYQLAAHKNLAQIRKTTNTAFWSNCKTRLLKNCTTAWFAVPRRVSVRTRFKFRNFNREHVQTLDLEATGLQKHTEKSTKCCVSGGATWNGYEKWLIVQISWLTDLEEVS